ncbi:Vacuolar protein sorting-associated protein 37A, partial [Ophiophagus hannah]
SSPSSAGGVALPSTLTSLQQQRQRQIESLRSAHAAIAEIQKDVEYRLPFTVNNLTININILLPPQFPQDKPVISVFPPIRHHIIDKQGAYVTSPLINSPTGIPTYGQNFPFLSAYLPQETNRPVASVPLAESLSSGYSTDRPAAPSFGMITDLPLPVPTTETQGNQNGFGYKMPDVPDVFLELSELSISQLTDMNEQEDVLLEQFVNLPQLKHIINDKDDLVKSIEELAKKNLLLEPSLESKRQTILDKYEQLIHFKTTFEKKVQRQHELSESCSASALQARLKVAAHEAEEESDTIAEDFLEGKTEIDDFLSSFMEKRTICHCRRAKEEKLQQAIAMRGQFHAPL